MGFLRRSKPAQVGAGTASKGAFFSGSAADLKRIGTAAYGGDSPHLVGQPGVATSELDIYAMAFMEASGYPTVGTPVYATARDRFLRELNDAAATGGDWSYVGAFMIARNALADPDDSPVYLSLLDRGLEVLRSDGVSYASVPPYALKRYEQVHGYAGGGPANWPSALHNIEVPAVGAEPPTAPLAVGEARHVAGIVAMRGGPRKLFAECREDGRVFAVYEGIVEDGNLARWDWDGVEGSDYTSFLRELGERLVTPSPWFHEELASYFPCRQKTRDEMRTEARQAGQASGGGSALIR